MGVSFSSESLAWVSETDEQNLPRATQSILLCHGSGDVSQMLSKLRELNVLIHFKSDAEKFEAQLKPITFQGSLILQTKIELVHNCTNSEEIAQALS